MAKGLLIWLAGGAGTFLLYAAVSNQTPLSLLQSYLGGGTPSPFATAAGGGSGPQFGAGNTKGSSPGPVPWLPQLPNDPPAPAKPGQTPDTSPKQNYYNGSPLASYGGGGVYDLIDANGNNLGAIPAAYQNNPNAYVPPPGGKVTLNA